MKHFVRDEMGYLRWLQDHPDAYVLNVPHSTGGVLVLHRAHCSYIRGHARSNFTGGQYTKLCALLAEDLRLWARKGSRRLNACGSCYPDGATAMSPGTISSRRTDRIIESMATDAASSRTSTGPRTTT